MKLTLQSPQSKTLLAPSSKLSSRRVRLDLCQTTISLKAKAQSLSNHTLSTFSPSTQQIKEPSNRKFLRTLIYRKSMSFSRMLRTSENLTPIWSLSVMIDSSSTPATDPPPRHLSNLLKYAPWLVVLYPRNTFHSATPLLHSHWHKLKERGIDWKNLR